MAKAIEEFSICYSEKKRKNKNPKIIKGSILRNRKQS